MIQTIFDCEMVIVENNLKALHVKVSGILYCLDLYIVNYLSYRK